MKLYAVFVLAAKVAMAQDGSPLAAPGNPFPIPSGGGFGCYGVGGTFGACNCSPELCNPSACAAALGSWTTGCTSCQCSTPSTTPNGPSPSPPSGEGGELTSSETTGFGCFSLGSNTCSCDPSVCSNSTCQASGGLWDPNCTTCQCETIVEASTSNVGYGCFGLPSAPTECDCSSEVCTLASCTAGGGLWTDRCTQCQCATEQYGCYNLTLDVCEEEEQAMWMVPFDRNDAMQLNLSEPIMNILYNHVGCYNSTIETCNILGGIWQGNDTGVPGTRMGCFLIEDQQCDCSIEMCNKTHCNSADGMLWWSDCLNCQCSTFIEDANGENNISGFNANTGASASTGGDGSNPGDGNNAGGGNTGGIPVATPGVPFPIPSGGGFGCYGVGGTFGACNCSPELCNPSACAAAQGTWTTGCTSCQCSTPSVPTTTPPGPSPNTPNGPSPSPPSGGGAPQPTANTGFGCYAIGGVRACNCSPQFCSTSSCEAAGGTWTDGCTSCRCPSTQPTNPTPTITPPGPSPNTPNGPSPSPPSGGGAPQPTANTGFGCYAIGGVRACNCSPQFCSTSSCEAAGGTWTDGCTSCRCPSTQPTNPTPTITPPGPSPNTPNGPSPSPPSGGGAPQPTTNTGFGCYGISGVRACNCSPQFCSTSSCEAAGGTWTDGCTSCQCSSIQPPAPQPIPAPVNTPQPTSPMNAPTPTVVTGFGCYGIGGGRSCNCSPEYCGESACSTSGGTWTDGCTSCQCSSIQSPAPQPTPAPVNTPQPTSPMNAPTPTVDTGFGCYGIGGGRSCNCSPEYCGESACSTSGGTWTDGCTSCQCSSIQPPAPQPTPAPVNTPQPTSPMNAPTPTVVTGFGCYGIGGGRSCNCSPEYCGESACSTSGGTWTDGCTSCQCSSIQPPAPQPIPAPVNTPQPTSPMNAPTPTVVTGFGCYGIGGGRSCNCSPEYCGESACSTSGGTWTDGCTSCQCSSIQPPAPQPTPAPVNTPQPTSPMNAPTPTVVTGFGCYGIGGGRSCNCSPEYCGESACSTSGGTWTDGCTSCQCSSIQPPAPQPTPAPVNTPQPTSPMNAPTPTVVTGFGCYGIGGGRSCNCSPEYCGESACSTSGGTWTDGCTSCQCT